MESTSWVSSSMQRSTQERNTISGRRPSALQRSDWPVVWPYPLKHHPLLGSNFDRSFKRGNDTLHAYRNVVSSIRRSEHPNRLLNHESMFATLTQREHRHDGSASFTRDTHSSNRQGRGLAKKVHRSAVHKKIAVGEEQEDSTRSNRLDR